MILIPLFFHKYHFAQKDRHFHHFNIFNFHKLKTPSAQLKKDTPSIKSIKLTRPNTCTSVKSATEIIKPSSIQPVNVANSRRTFRLFRSEIEGTGQAERRKDLAVAIVTEACAKEPTLAIGNRIVGIEDKKKKDRKTEAQIYGDRRICGIAFYWGVDASYYMPFDNTTGMYRFDAVLLEFSLKNISKVLGLANIGF